MMSCATSDPPVIHLMRLAHEAGKAGVSFDAVLKAFDKKIAEGRVATPSQIGNPNETILRSNI